MENKTSKYFKYAIGEIILVVIGILIALQINNWNENRKSNNKVIEYKKGLIEDLQRDVLRIDEALVRIKEYEIQQNNFTKRLSHPKATTDTLVKIAKDEFLGYFDNIDVFHTATFQSLISTGDISLFPKTIRTKLIELNNQQQTTLLISKEVIDSYMSQLTTYKYLSNLPMSAIQSGKLYDSFWANVNKEELVKDFYSVNLRLNNIFRTSKSAYTKTRKEIIAILDTLNNK
jgi:hypothetical protein